LSISYHYSTYFSSILSKSYHYSTFFSSTSPPPTTATYLVALPSDILSKYSVTQLSHVKFVIFRFIFVFFRVLGGISSLLRRRRWW
jgi:hypothetical protein